MISRMADLIIGIPVRIIPTIPPKQSITFVAIMASASRSNNRSRTTRTGSGDASPH